MELLPTIFKGIAIIAGEIFGGQPGTSIPVKFGTRYVMGATANLTQKLFDPSLKLGH